MRRQLIACAFVFVPTLATAAAAPKTPEAVWSGALEAGRAKIVSQAPKFSSVHLVIDRGVEAEAVISEPSLGVNVDISRGGGDSFWINGYLKGNAIALDRRSTLSGLSLMGGGVNVEIRPSGADLFLLDGVYKDAEGKDGALKVRLHVIGRPMRDLAVHEQGLDLSVRWRATGYEISGKADPRLYGKRELAIIGASIATLTWDVFGR